MKLKIIILLVSLMLVGCNSNSNSPSEVTSNLEILQDSINEMTIEVSEKINEIKLLQEEIQDLKTENAILSNDNIILQQMNENNNEKWEELTEDEKSLIDYANSYIGVFHFDVTDEDQYVFFPKKKEIKIGPIKYGPNVASVWPGTLALVLEKANISHVGDGETWYYIEIPNYAEPMNTRGWIKAVDIVKYVDIDIAEVKNVAIEIGSDIYHCLDYENINNAEVTTLQSRGRGWIKQRKNGYVFLTLPGGDRGWTKEENILIPDKESNQ